jgi:hypothetical protein
MDAPTFLVAQDVARHLIARQKRKLGVKMLHNLGLK